MIKKVQIKLKRLIYMMQHQHQVLSSIQNHNNIFYFGIPMHPNLGDLAQYVCIRDWLQANYPQYNVVEVDSKVFMSSKSRLRAKLKKKIHKDDLILFQSGYCTQDLGGIEDLMHQAVIQDYPENRLLMMPQTVYFKSPQRKAQASQVYDSHKRLLFLARDQVSFEMAKLMFPHRAVYAYPDIVTTMIGKYHFNKKRAGILFCMRNDEEKYYSSAEIDGLEKALRQFDRVEQTDTTVPTGFNAHTPKLKELIEKYIENFAEYRLIVTDRYHGTIFSLIAQTPVIVIKTTDHKVKTGVDWFKGVYDTSVVYAENLQDAIAYAQSFLSRNSVVDNEPYFEQEYYRKLKNLLEENIGAS